MPSSLFPKNNSTMFNAVAALNSAANGNPQQLYSQMYQTNPQFREFADSMRGKTPEQAFSENGLDFNQFRHLF